MISLCNVPETRIEKGRVPAPNTGDFCECQLGLHYATMLDAQACRLDSILTRFRSCSNPRRANSCLPCQTCRQVLQSTGRASSILQSPDQPCQASKWEPLPWSPIRWGPHFHKAFGSSAVLPREEGRPDAVPMPERIVSLRRPCSEALPRGSDLPAQPLTARASLRQSWPRGKACSAKRGIREQPFWAGGHWALLWSSWALGKGSPPASAPKTSRLKPIAFTCRDVAIARGRRQTAGQKRATTDRTDWSLGRNQSEGSARAPSSSFSSAKHNEGLQQPSKAPPHLQKCSWSGRACVAMFQAGSSFPGSKVRPKPCLPSEPVCGTSQRSLLTCYSRLNALPARSGTQCQCRPGFATGWRSPLPGSRVSEAALQGTAEKQPPAQDTTGAVLPSHLCAVQLAVETIEAA